MAVIKIGLPRPHPAQAEILKHEGSAVTYAGRRFGKTQLAVYRIFKAATRQVGLYWWVGLSWRSASLKRAWRLLKFYARKIWKAVGEPNYKYIREADHEILLPNGSAIWLRSADNPDSLAGEGLRGVVLDEFSLMADNVWGEYIEAALLDYNGWAFFIGVPKGQNWAYYLWLQAQSRPNWKAFHFTTYDNPFISPERIDDIKANTPEILFAQEYMAEVTADAGAVFRGVKDVLTAPPEASPQQGRRYVFGVDWARQHDYTVIVVLDRDTRQMVAMERFNQVSWSLQRGRLRALYDRWQPDAIWAEENSIGSPNIEALQAEGLPVQAFTTTAITKNPLIETLALAIERKEIALQNDPVLVGELTVYSMERLPSGNYRYGAPSGLHDDCVIALALAWHGIKALYDVWLITG